MPSSSTTKADTIKLKQSRLSFLPTKNVAPTLVKIDGTPSASKTNLNSPQPKTNDMTTLKPKSLKKSTEKVTHKTASNSLSGSKSSSSKKEKLKTVKSNKKQSLNGTKGKKQTISISDSDDNDEDMPLSVLKSKISPLKKPSFAPTKVVFPEKLNPQNVKAIKVSPVKSIPLGQVKLTSASIQKLLPNLKGNVTTIKGNFTTVNGNVSRGNPLSINHPIVGALPMQNKVNLITGNHSSNARPIFIVPANQMKPQPKNLVIAVDMEPQKWAKLTPLEQQKIINEKRSQAPQKYFTVAIKNPITSQALKTIPTASSTIAPKNIHRSTLIPPKMNCNSNLITTSTVPQSSKNPGSAHTIRPNVMNNFNLMERRMETDLPDLKPLPKLKRVKIPQQLSGKYFGDLLMVTEFIEIYKSFLGMEENFLLVTGTLLHDIANQKESESVLKVLLYFLKVLLGNETYKIRGLKIELADLPLTEFTVSFLVEQFLKSYLDKKKKQKRAEEIAIAAAKILQDDQDEEKQTIDLDEWEENEDPFFDDYDEEEERKRKNRKKKQKPKALPKRTNTFEEEEMAREMKYQTISKFLEKNEFHQLSPYYQIEIMTFLMNKILESEEFQSYQDDLMVEKVEAARALELYRRNKREEKMAEFKKNNPKIDDFVHKIPNPSQLNANVQAAANGTAVLESKGNETITVNENKDVRKEDTNEKKEDTKEDPYAGMTQRQIQAIKTEAKQNEEKKLEELRLTMEKERNEIKELTKKIDEANCLYQRSQRLETLGYDRFNRTYWLFSNNNPGLFICSFQEWYVIDNVKAVDDLICNLSFNGIREDRLRRSLRAHYKKIVESIKLRNSLHSDDGVSPMKQLATNKKIEKKSGETNKIIVGEEGSSVRKNEDAVLLNGTIKTNGENDCENKSPSKDDHKLPNENKKDDGKLSNEDKKGGDNLPNEDKKGGDKLPNEDKKSDDKSPNEGKKDIVDSTEMENKTTSKVAEEDDKTKNNKLKDAGEDSFPSSIEALKCDLYESSARIVQGNLGVISNYDQWTASLTDVSLLGDIKTFVSSIQRSIFEKSLLTPFKGFDPAFTTEWTKAVENAETLSKLHTMYGILENSISWERSSESLRCNACRRKQGVRNSTPMVVCDGCQNSYHLNCIRPPLSEIPQCVWICPKCAPKNVTRSKVFSPYSDQNQLNASSTSQVEEESDHEDLCHVCKTDGMMILCDTCPLSFHFECHDPPLRRAPKGSWSCFECRKVNLKKMLKKKGKVSSPEHSHSPVDSDEEAFETEKAQKKVKAKSNKNTNPTDNRNEKRKTTNIDNNRKMTGRKRKQVDYKESVSEGESENDRNKKLNDTTNNKTNSKRKRKSRETSEGDWEASLSSDTNSLSLSIKRPRYAKDSLNDRKSSTSSVNKNDEIDSNVKINGDQKESNSKHKKENSNGGRRKSRSSRRDTNCELKACHKILTELRKNPDAEHFRDPVNRREVPGYYNIIDKPMNLNKIMEKLDSIQYEDVLGFVSDVKLIFSNCRKFHKDPLSVIRNRADQLEESFENLLSQYLPGMEF